MEHRNDPDAQRRQRRRGIHDVALACGATAAIAVCAYAEWPTVIEVVRKPILLLAYPAHPLTTLPCLALAVLLVIWLRTGGYPQPKPRSIRVPGRLGKVLVCVAVFAAGVIACSVVGLPFRGLPPAYHDEFSYLFQAHTFLAGRLYFEPHPLAAFFDQMHVLNDDGVFASRYFPGVGLFYAPFVALGVPLLGNYLAVGLIGVFLCLLGWRLGLGWSAVVAAVVCVVVPPLPVFANLLLSHIPTTLGLVVCLWAYVASLERFGGRLAFVSGVGLALALLCRPLTAFGFSVPLALHGVWRLSRGRSAVAWRWALAGLIPVVAGLAALGWYNEQLTGSPLRSPYGKYLDIYTPRHRYGFYNVSRGAAYDNPKVLRNYDSWARELTPLRAVQLAILRAATVGRWTVGVTAAAFLATAGVFFAVAAPRWWLIVLPALGVHLAYFPYAFEGIFGLSYVFESVPLAVLWFVATVAWLAGRFRADGRGLVAVGLFLFLVANWIRFGVEGERYVVLGGPVDELRAARSQILFAKRYYADFDRLLARAVQPPALVFIKPDPTDRHRDLVYNIPPLNGPVLRARDRGPHENARLMEYYPDREVWLYDARSGRLYKLRDRLPRGAS